MAGNETRNNEHLELVQCMTRNVHKYYTWCNVQFMKLMGKGYKCSTHRLLSHDAGTISSHLK